MQRAVRFGLVSDTLASAAQTADLADADQEAKRKARAERFAAKGGSQTDENEKRKIRFARFGGGNDSVRTIINIDSNKRLKE
jgi:hypothetical protein